MANFFWLSNNTYIYMNLMRKRNKYSPNIDEVEKQLKVLKGIDLIDDKYLSSLNKDFILLKGDYSPRTINYMKTCNWAANWDVDDWGK